MKNVPGTERKPPITNPSWTERGWELGGRRKWVTRPDKKDSQDTGIQGERVAGWAKHPREDCWKGTFVPTAPREAHMRLSALQSAATSSP
jgi:hypothetical protein